MADERKKKGNGEEQEEPRVIIEDLRHSRDVEAAAEEAAAKPQPAAVAEPPSASDPAEEAVLETPIGFTEPERDSAAPPAEGEGTQQPLTEDEQIRFVFEAGVEGYLAGQIHMLINFALIYLGRAANPASGLINVDLDRAKLTIDTFEFISSKIKAQLSAEEQAQLAALLSDLKYWFMQAATGAPGPGAPNPQA